jgi:hypothetical protein
MELTSRLFGKVNISNCSYKTPCLQILPHIRAPFPVPRAYMQNNVHSRGHIRDNLILTAEFVVISLFIHLLIILHSYIESACNMTRHAEVDHLHEGPSWVQPRPSLRHHSRNER